MRSVNLGRWSRRVERYFNIKGGGGLSDVDPSVRLTLWIQSGNEDRYLEGWNRFAISAAAGPQAATSAGIQLRNPPASNCVLVLERLSVRLDTATTNSPVSLTFQQTTGDLTTAGTGNALDPRGNANSVGITSVSVSAGALANSYSVVSIAGLTPFEFIQTLNQEIVIMPGQAYRLIDGTVNEVLRANLLWRERPLETSELT